MFKRMNFKNQLALLLILTLAIVAQQFVLSSGNQASFTAKPFLLEVEKIDKISIKDSKNEVVLEKGLTHWIVKQPNQANADANAIDALLSEIEKLTFNYVADTGSDKFANYELSDSLATQLQVWQAGQPVAKLYLGKFEYDQTTRQLTTHVRLNNSENIYAVNGFLKMTINTDEATYRNKQLVETERTSINQIDISGTQESFSLVKQENGWFIGEEKTDSTATELYLEKMALLSSRFFLNELPPDAHKTSTVKIFADGELKAQLDFYTQDSTVVAAQSSLNRGTIFDATQMDLEIILPSRNRFLTKEPLSQQ